MTYSYVELLEGLEVDSVLYGLGLVGCCLVGFLRCLEFIKLLLYRLVLNLLKEKFGLCQLMTGFEKLCTSEFVPVKCLEINEFAQFGTAEWQERFEGYSEIGYELQRYVEHCLHALRVGLPHLPWLTFSNIAVAYAGKVHGLFLCLAELERVEHLLHILLHILELIECLTVNILKFTTGGYHSVPIFLCELEGTVYEVTIDSHKFAVVALLEVLPSEVIVLCLRGVGGEHISKHILLAWQVLKIFMKPHCPIA